jgi:hypothetical protein
MLCDKDNIQIRVGDIVRIEESPLKSKNGTYIVAHAGPTAYWTGSEKELCLYRVSKVGGKYALSVTNTTVFYPLYDNSSRRLYSCEDLSAATIEIIEQADRSKIRVVYADKAGQPTDHLGGNFYRVSVATINHGTIK